MWLFYYKEGERSQIKKKKQEAQKWEKKSHEVN